MPKTAGQPRLLTAVMDAIANLKEGRGSTQKKIIDRVQCLLSANNLTLRNPTAHIRKAIKHGVETGLIRHKAGKFKLGLDSKDYAIFKSFQKTRKRNFPLREHRHRHRHRRGKRRRKHRRRRRRRSTDKPSPDEDASGSGSASGSISGTPEPTDKGRRRRKKRRRRGRRRATGSDESSDRESSENKDIASSVSKENSTPPTKSDRDREKDRDRELNRSSDEEHCEEATCGNERAVGDPTCGNPECLCNLTLPTNDDM